MRGQKFWIVLGLLSVYLIYLMVINFIDVIVYSIFIYYVARPVYDRLVRRLKSQHISAFIALFLLILPVTLVMLYGLGVASLELLNFMRVTRIPYGEAISNIVSQYSTVISEIQPQDIVTLVRDDKNFQGIWSLITTIFLTAMGIIFKLMLMFTIALYLLMDGKHIRKWLVKNLYPNQQELTGKFLSGIDLDLHRVFSGSILTAFFIAIMGSLVFNILNEFAPKELMIPYPILLGMVCGITSLVPMVGVALLWVPATIVLIVYAYFNALLFTDLWFIVLFTISTAVLVDWGPNLIFKPHVTGRYIHPGLMLMAYLLGPIAFGLAGLFLGPIILVVSLNFMKTIFPEFHR